MNIILLGHHDIASLYALDRVIGLLPEHDYSVLLSSDAQSTPADDTALARLARADADLCDRFLSGEIRGAVASVLAASPPPSLSSPNSPQGLGVLEELQPDLVISIRYRRILREEAIAIPRLGVINLHSGILPDYRGVMATFWAMLAGEKEIGTTLHWIVDSGIDTGPVIGIRRKPARPGATYLTNVLGLYADGCSMIADAVRAIAEGRKPGGSAQPPGGQYFAAPGVRDVERFEARGLALFDGSEDAQITYQM